MAGATAIEWTEMTWNPVTGCTKVSEGCKFCYAERMAKRLQSMGVRQYSNGFRVTLVPHVLPLPLKWRTPRMVFVNSMSDLFHEDVPLCYIKRVFKVMRKSPQHIFQVLTKRSERLADLAPRLDWTDNIWMGVSVENESVSFRIAHLIQTPARIKFVSLEPLIGPVKSLFLESTDWIIVGGESGPKARPVKKQWIDSVHKKCRTYQVPFFFKQWGTAKWNPNQSDPTIIKGHMHYAKGGCQLDGRIYREMPVNMIDRQYRVQGLRG
jgi:protein gp37